MRNTFRIFAILSLLAVGAVIWADSRQNDGENSRELSPIAAIARADNLGLPSGDEVMEASQSRLLAHRSVAAQVRQRVQLFDRQLFGSGVYLQQQSGAGQQFRFELEFPLADRKRGILQSSDGVTLWLSDSNASSVALRKVDLEQLGQTVGRYETAAGQAPGQVLAAADATLHGGLPKLLADLRKNFNFHTVGQSEIAGVPVLVIRGVWRPESIDQLTEQESDAEMADRARTDPTDVDLSKLAPHVPHEVLLYLDREELFPYRIQYRRMEKQGDEAPAQPRTLVEMELFQVRFDAPIEASQFAKPVDVPATDHTDAFAKRLVQEYAE